MSTNCEPKQTVTVVLVFVDGDVRGGVEDRVRGPRRAVEAEPPGIILNIGYRSYFQFPMISKLEFLYSTPLLPYSLVKVSTDFSCHLSPIGKMNKYESLENRI